VHYILYLSEYMFRDFHHVHAVGSVPGGLGNLAALSDIF
jgi:hypothetical protein